MPPPDSPFPKANPSSPADELTVAPGPPTRSEDDLATSPPAGEALDDGDAPVLELGRMLGGYRLERQLGAGGMGAVFLAEDVKLQRKVALKVMKPEVAAKKTARERFLREARAAAHIEHPHIIPILGIGEEDGIPFIAMPFLKGEPLDARLKHGRLGVPEILTIGWQTADGLGAAHEQGMIHRDIKPANIWLETAPRGGAFNVKILDFGLARLAGGDEHLTQTGAIMGTPAYMAPEQVRSLPVDHRADLFSLGVVLYEMATGERPFKGRDTMGILSSLALDTPPAPSALNPELPPSLSNLIEHLLEKEPDRRLGSANDAADVLKRLQPESTIVVIAQSRPAVTVDPWANIDASSATNVVEAPGLVRDAKPVAGDAVSGGRSKKPLFIGGGLVAAGLVVAAIFLFGNKKNDNTAPPAKQDSTAKVSPIDKKSNHQAKPESPPAAFTNSIGMEFALVPKGKSWLGGGKDKLGVKEVVIARDFYLGVYEVTQEEWEHVAKTNPSTFKAVPGVAKEDQKRFPVENVSWDDCQAFIKRLNERTREAGWEYRLPTETEWEYACRGGPMTDKAESAFDYYLDKPSNTLSPAQANIKDNDLMRTCKVGSYLPNRLGLYDMHGNVWEWCLDEVPADPKDPKGASRRVYRGGGMNRDSVDCRAAHRFVHPPSDRYDYLGLRLARVPVGSGVKQE